MSLSRQTQRSVTTVNQLLIVMSTSLLICMVIILILTILQCVIFILLLCRNRTKPLRMWCLAALSLLLATLAAFILSFLGDKDTVPILLVLFKAVYQTSFFVPRCSWPVGATIICLAVQAHLCVPLSTSKTSEEPWPCIILLVFILGYALIGLMYLALFEGRPSLATEHKVDDQISWNIILCCTIIIAALISSILYYLSVVDHTLSLLVSKINLITIMLIISTDKSLRNRYAYALPNAPNALQIRPRALGNRWSTDRAKRSTVSPLLSVWEQCRPHTLACISKFSWPLLMI